MPYETPPPMRPGSMPKWRDLNDAYSAIHELGESSSAFGSDLAIDRNSGQLQVNDYSTPGHWAKITGVSGGLYSHQQIAPDGTVLPAALPYYFGGTTSTTTPARELNGATVPTNSIVWLEIDTERRGWVFVYGGAGGGSSPTGIFILIGAQPTTGSTHYAFTQYAPPATGATTAVTGGATGDGTANWVQDIGGTFNDAGIVGGYAWAYPNPLPGMTGNYIMGPWVKKVSYPIDHLEPVCDDDGTLSVTVVYSTTPVIEFRIGK